jgi:putative membrane protein
MIVRDKPGFYELAFALKGSILPAIAWPLLVLLAVGMALTVLGETGLLPRIEPAGFTIFGLALSLFLGFRNNAAYDRWWEARKLWGGLLVDMRALQREVVVFVADHGLQQAILRDALAFLHLHRAQLRRLEGDAECLARAPELMAAASPPCAALDRMNARIAEAHRAGEIDGFGARTLSGRLASMGLQQASCERIQATPLPFVYSLLVYRTTWLYCLLLPLALVQAAGWFTPVLVAIVAYVFLGLAEVSEELAHPFATTPNGLPLDAICRAAEISLAPALGESVPERRLPQDYYLS